MKDLNYERIAHIIAVSAVSRDSAIMSQLCVASQELRIRFSEYVKSQIHLNIVEDLYKRSVSEYAKALYYLNGNGMYKDTAEKVLEYFYRDLAAFLINNPVNIKLNIVIDFEVDNEFVVNLADVKEQFTAILQTVQRGENPVDCLQKFPYSFIFDDVESTEDAISKCDSYALAAVLKEESKKREVSKLLIVGE